MSWAHRLPHILLHLFEPCLTWSARWASPVWCRNNATKGDIAELQGSMCRCFRWKSTDMAEKRVTTVGYYEWQIIEKTSRLADCSVHCFTAVFFWYGRITIHHVPLSQTLSVHFPSSLNRTAPHSCLFVRQLLQRSTVLCSTFAEYWPRTRAAFISTAAVLLNWLTSQQAAFCTPLFVHRLQCSCVSCVDLN